MSYWDSLQQASLGGVPFGVLGTEASMGRRVHLHKYPFRDTLWPEDLGQGATEFNVTGFLVEDDGVTGGGDVIAQRNALEKLAISKGPLTLVHPTRGTLKVVVAEGAFRCIERWDAGRYFELSIGFILWGQRLFPSVAVSTGSAVSSAVSTANVAMGTDFANGVSSLFSISQSVIGQAVTTASQWAAMALTLGSDASAIYNMTAELQGSYGRFFGGSINGFLANAAPSAGVAPTVASLISQGSANLAAITIGANALSGSAASGQPAAIVAAAQAITAAVLDATVNPADTIRLLTVLASFVPDDFTTADVVGQAMASVQTAMGNLFRRVAVVTAANASSSYQPSSANDATTILTAVIGLLDNEIEIAGDNFEDTTFGALRALRQAVVTDLNSRGAALPALKTFTYQAPLPAAVLALRIYRDASRADQLVSEAAPPHPAFMPTSFQALSR